MTKKPKLKWWVADKKYGNFTNLYWCMSCDPFSPILASRSFKSREAAKHHARRFLKAHGIKAEYVE